MVEPKRIILFASGNGSNAINVCNYFKNSNHVKVVSLFCNNQNARVLQKIIQYDIQVHLFDKSQLNNPDYFLPLINQYKPDLICLLGFLLKIPAYLVQAYPNKIINLHPALLPKYGGKGMYGKYVHEAVKNSGEKETGITVHYVNEHYDDGDIIEQHKVLLNENDGVADIANKIVALEMKYVPLIIEKILLKNN